MPLLLLMAVAVSWAAWTSVQEHRLDEAIDQARAIAKQRQVSPSAPPWTGPDARALAVDAQARRLGYSLRMDPGTPANAHAPPGGQPHQHGLREYLDRAVSDEDGRPRPPSGTRLGQWLRVNAAEIDALVDVVESGPLPRWFGAWDSVPPEYQAPPGAAWIGQLWTGRILTAAALDSAARGQDEEAERRLLAAWHLRDSIAAEPSLMSGLIAETLLSEQLAVLRKLKRPGRGWDERLAELEPVEDRLDFLVMDALRLSRSRGQDDTWARFLQPNTPRRARLFAWATTSDTGRRIGLRALGEPLRLGYTGSEVRSLADQVRAAEAAAPCPPDLDALSSRLEKERGAMSWMGQEPGVGLLVRAHEARLHLDLTRAVLAMRRGELADGDAFAGSCSRWAWRATVSGDGSRALRFAGPRPDWVTEDFGTLDWTLER